MQPLLDYFTTALACATERQVRHHCDKRLGPSCTEARQLRSYLGNLCLPCHSVARSHHDSLVHRTHRLCVQVTLSLASSFGGHTLQAMRNHGQVRGKTAWHGRVGMVIDKVLQSPLCQLALPGQTCDITPQAFSGQACSWQERMLRARPRRPRFLNTTLPLRSDVTAIGLTRCLPAMAEAIVTIRMRCSFHCCPSAPAAPVSPR